MDHHHLFEYRFLFVEEIHPPSVERDAIPIANSQAQAVLPLQGHLYRRQDCCYLVRKEDRLASYRAVAVDGVELLLAVSPSVRETFLANYTGSVSPDYLVGATTPISMTIEINQIVKKRLAAAEQYCC